MPVVNNLHNENRPKRHTSDIRPHKRNKTKRRRGKKQTRWNIKLNHQPKKRQRRRSFILGDSNWNFFQVGYPVDTPTDKSVTLWTLLQTSRLPCGHSYRLGASSLEIRTGNFFQVGHPVDTPTERSFILGDSNWNFFQVGYPVDTPTDISIADNIFVSMYIMCVILCLFSALSRTVGALQISIIMMIIIINEAEHRLLTLVPWA